MASYTINVTVEATSPGPGRYALGAKLAGTIADLTASKVTDVTTAIGVLQADAASPTEAHVDTADTAWIALNAEIAALQLLLGASDVQITYNASTVLTRSQLRAIFAKALQEIENSGTLTA